MMVALALSSLVVGGTTAAQTLTDGNELYDECRGGDDPQDSERAPKRELVLGEGVADAQ